MIEVIWQQARKFWQHGGHWISALLAALIFSLAIASVVHLFQAHSLQSLRDYFETLPREHIVWAFLTTVMSYGLLTLYDQMAFYYLRHDLGFIRVTFISFIAYALGNSIGMANVAGTSVRFRLYGRSGLKPSQILRVVFFCSLSFWLGFLALAGVTLLLNPPAWPETWWVPPMVLQALGWAFVLAVSVYLGLVTFRKKPFHVHRLSFRLPSLPLSLLQLSVASLDWAVAALALYWLMPVLPGLGFPMFLSIFVAAQVVSLVSHVPGGVGVFEVVLIHLLDPSGQHTPGILGALIVYRILYYILPLALGMVALMITEIFEKTLFRWGKRSPAA